MLTTVAILNPMLLVGRITQHFCPMREGGGPVKLAAPGPAMSPFGTNRWLEVGQSMSALPGYFRHRLVPLLPGHHPVCTENLNSDVVMVKPAEDRV
jgi:hypothetical protein